MGGPVAEVGRDRFGAPVWPEGFTGSFSHSGDETAVLVARSDRYLAVGLDWEVVGRIGVELWGAVFTPREVAFLRRMARPELATALFAAKEAVQKARYAASWSWTAVEGFEVALREERFGVRGDETLAGWFRGDGRRVVAACGIRSLGAETESTAAFEGRS
ncbi:MAG: 4'-phosphopantetheinyl transferase superfamily protein [Acidobacteriota bacterium]